MTKIKRQVALTLLTCALAFPAYTHIQAEAGVLFSQAVHDKVTGTIEDAMGPVIGAAVVVKGTSNGCITDMDGNFSLDGVKKGTVLKVSYVGYIPQEVTYQGKSLKIKMIEDTKMLDDVVVVGYATVKKANLTGAVSAIDSKVLEDRPLVNLGQGLQGAIPNLNIKTSGRPGDGSSFNIRGTMALDGSTPNGPLVLVDGVQMDPNLINPQDVKSVSVLKDAASAAIYGARAAYGVVLITMKEGRKDQPIQVSFDASVSFNGPTTRPTFMNSMEYANWMNKAQNNDIGRDFFDAETYDHIKAYYNDPVNNSPVFIHSDSSQSNNGTTYTYCGNTNWLEELYKNNYPIQQYNVNISGGGGKATYYTSLGYTDQGSMMRFGDEQYKKFNIDRKSVV